ncbi:MAG: protease-like activity factor CPAF [Pseudomonadota bacterium]
MKRIQLVLIPILLITTFSSTAFARFTQDERVSDATTLISKFEHSYAPLEWKKTYLNIDFEALKRQLLDKAKSDISDAEFYKAILHFMAGLEDAHIRASAPVSKSAVLPFSVDQYEGEIVVTEISSDPKEKTPLPFAIGDRLISIDGATAETVRDNMAVLGTVGNERSQKRLAAGWITHRYAERFIDVPDGEAHLKFQRRKDNKIIEVTLPWKVTGFDLANDKALTLKSNKSTFTDKKKTSSLETFRTSIFDSSTYTSSGMGEERPFFPLWKNFVERHDAPFYSGIIVEGDHKIGFMRIPHWGFMASSIESFLDEEISYLEEHTDALIIDQTNNPGGNLCAISPFISYFITEEALPSAMKIRANRSWLMEFEGMIDNEKALDPDQVIIKTTIDKIRYAMDHGDRLSDPIFICESDLDGKIKPHKTYDEKLSVYTKPVLILINELAASCGDIFPANMQDIGRALLFGTRTMGGGGNVTWHGPIGHADIFHSMTESLVWRSKAVRSPKGIETHYIENVGAIPDIEYKIGIDDFLNDYKKYRETIMEAVLGLIKK